MKAIIVSNHNPTSDKMSVLPIFLALGKEILRPNIKMKNRGMAAVKKIIIEVNHNGDPKCANSL